MHVAPFEIEGVREDLKDKSNILEEKTAFFESTPKEIHQMSFFEGQNFGEGAMNNEQGTRGGTCIAEEETFCAIIDRATYVKIMRKLNQEKVTRITKFLR